MDLKLKCLRLMLKHPACGAVFDQKSTIPGVPPSLLFFRRKQPRTRGFWARCARTAPVFGVHVLVPRTRARTHHTRRNCLFFYRPCHTRRRNVRPSSCFALRRRTSDAYTRDHARKSVPVREHPFYWTFVK